MMWEWWWF